MSQERNFSLNMVAIPIAIGMAYFVAAYFALMFTRNSQGIATVWPASGVLVAGLYLCRGRWFPISVCVFVGSMVANLAWGTSPYNAVGFTISNLIEGSIVVFLFRKVFGEDSIVNLDAAGKFALSGVVGALVSAVIATTWQGAWNTSFFMSWFATVMLGILIGAPLVMSIMGSREKRGGTFSLKLFAQGVLVMTLVLATSLAVVVYDRFPLLFLPFASMLVATYRLGTFGAAASVATNALVGSLAIAFNIGPLTHSAADQVAIIYFFQFYLLTMLASAQPLAMLLREYNLALGRLEENNRWLAMAERSANVGHWRYNVLDGTAFWSDEVFRMHGVPTDKGIEPSVTLLKGLTHPDDLEFFDETVQKAIAEAQPYSTVHRIIRPDGEVRFLESRGQPQFDESGRLIAMFGIFQDVTDRMEVLRELERAQERAELDAEKSRQIAETDQLTGAASRRKIIGQLSEQLSAAKKGETTFTIALIDIDHFKAINDSFGHPVGDEVLVRLADCARLNLRKSDGFGRLGGEEFLVIMPDTDLETGQQVVEKLRRKIEELTWVKHPGMRVTVSMGVASYVPGADENWMLQASDQALYQAKRGGRNCLRIAA